jgi:hypothetical protein
VELVQLESSVAVRSLQHRNLRPDALEPHDAVHPAALDGPLALELESELGEELSRGREVVNHDADVLHPLDRQVLDGTEPRFEHERRSAHLALSLWTRSGAFNKKAGAGGEILPRRCRAIRS